jgi:REP element-mobilizing transposase RayT
VDRQDFLKILAETCQKTDWQVHAYCLMGNHFHLVVETQNANHKAIGQGKDLYFHRATGADI